MKNPAARSPVPAGLYRRHRALYATLAEALARRGHHVTVLCRSASPGVGLQQAEENGVRRLACAGQHSMNRRFCPPFGDAPARDAFEHVLGQAAPDRVHIQHLIGSRPVCCAPSRAGHPYAVTLHDYWWVCAMRSCLPTTGTALRGSTCLPELCPLCAGPGGPGGLWPAVPSVAWPLSWRGSQLRAALRRASQVIAPSAFVQAWYNAHCIPEKRIEVLPHGLEWPSGLRRSRSPADPLRLLYLAAWPGRKASTSCWRPLAG